MTREEAIDLLDNLIGMVEDNHNSDYDTALQMGIKALEQEPILDKIRAEMEQIKEAEYQIYGKGSWRFVDKCLDVIDKYKAESEDDRYKELENPFNDGRFGG